MRWRRAGPLLLVALTCEREQNMIVHDEVCGMDIAPEDAVATTEFQGNTYHFCTERCLQRFEEHPGWYVSIKPDERADSTP